MLVNVKIQQQVERGVTILRQGGIVAFPTDTVYGLGVSAKIPRAVERIYEVKKRLRNMALPLLLANTSQISEVAESVSPLAWLLIRNFMPGGLTVVLPKAPSVPDIITAGGSTVAVRIPAHPIAIALIEGVGAPIVGTSANLSGKPAALTAAEVCAQFGDEIDLVIDGGKCPGGKESTIVDVTGGTPVILREGAISKQELERVVGKISIRGVE